MQPPERFGPHVPLNPPAASTTAASRPKPRKPRMVAPLDPEWEQNKPLIQELYMVQKMPLPLTIQTMRERHQFSATDKMYKERFKIWKWSKYLTKGRATWMMNKANERHPRGTQFQYGGQTWTEGRVRKTYDRFQGVSRIYELPPGDEDLPDAMDGPTPASITYETPAQLPETPTRLPEPPSPASGDLTGELSSMARVTSEENAAKSNFAAKLVSDIRTSLDELVATALRADVEGETNAAESKLLNAITIFKNSLSSTHPRTIKAVYMLAVMYAKRQKMDQADEALNWLTAEMLCRWGPRHRNTLVHFLRLVDLHQSWGRYEHAKTFTFKLLDSWDEIKDGRPLEIPSTADTAIVPESLDAHTGSQTQILEESSDVATVSEQLRLAGLWSSSNMTGVDRVLSRLIILCERYPEKLETQAIQARCSLASWYISREDKAAARQELKQAWRSLKARLRNAERVSNPDLRICRRLAFLYRDAHRQASCDEILEYAADVVERIVLVPRAQYSVCTALTLHISVGMGYQQRSSWSRARPWFERALALVIHAGGTFDPIAEKLTRALKDKKYTVTPLEGVSERFGVPQCVSRRLMFEQRALGI
ncbi:hypothetical protein QBC40DRAFT_176696 [Triangularia verruculosa]|uniref:Clr5 domain-containing protein n=1 Tax=Triangularia verruculosa TaxID=2587418 RepID=A0AAN7AUN0_9PEZI|nr:hypothetical protein QBC40DRAFT_176696 [Triangularia verruculosa]